MNVVFYLVFNFIFYSFIGWILEEGYSFSTTKKFQEDGFLIGPFKPMYGMAVMFLIICNELLEISGIPLILLCFLIPTTVEYISGYILKHSFNKVYWIILNLGIIFMDLSLLDSLYIGWCLALLVFIICNPVYMTYTWRIWKLLISL